MLRRAIQSVLSVALVLALALACAGCIGLSVDTKIEADGSGSRTIETTLDRSLSDVMRLSGPQSTKDFEKQLRDSLPPGATLRTFVRDGQTHYVARFSFASVADLSRINFGRSRRRGPGTPTASMRVSRNVIFTTYEFSETLPSVAQPLTDEERQFVSNLAAQYRLTMPGTITSSNADKSISASTASWKLQLTTGRSVKASSRVIHWPVIAGALLGLAAVAVAIVVIVVAARRRGSREGTTD